MLHLSKVTQSVEGFSKHSVKFGGGQIDKACGSFKQQGSKARGTVAGHTGAGHTMFYIRVLALCAHNISVQRIHTRSCSPGTIKEIMQSLKISLPDGRLLAYTEYGDP